LSPLLPLFKRSQPAGVAEYVKGGRDYPLLRNATPRNLCPMACDLRTKRKFNNNLKADKMKNVKTRKDNFFEEIVAEELKELSGTNKVAETNPDEMPTGHLSSEEFLYTTPFNEKNSQLAKNTDNDLVENIIYTP
jgi:hypothetical protein